MRTGITKKEVEAGKFHYSDHWEIFHAAENMLRAIYTLFGWTHMTKDFSRTGETIENLVESTIASIKKDGEESSCATAGIKVTAWYEDEGEFGDENLVLNIDLSFNIV